MIETARPQLDDRHVGVSRAHHALVVLQQIADGAAAGHGGGREGEQFRRVPALQHEADLMLPGIGRRARYSGRPGGRVQIAQAFARRHDEAVVEQPLNALRRGAVARELDPADQRLVAQGDEVELDVNGSPSSDVTKTPSLENLISLPTSVLGASSSMYLWVAVRLSGSAGLAGFAGTGRGAGVARELGWSSASWISGGRPIKGF